MVVRLKDLDEEEKKKQNSSRRPVTLHDLRTQDYESLTSKIDTTDLSHVGAPKKRSSSFAESQSKSDKSRQSNAGKKTPSVVRLPPKSLKGTIPNHNAAAQEAFKPKSQIKGQIDLPETHYPTTPGLAATKQDYYKQEAAARDKQLSHFPKILQKPLKVIGHGLDVAQANIPGLADFQQGAGHTLGVEAQTAPLTGGTFGKAAGFAGSLAGGAVNLAALEQSAVTGAGRVTTDALQRFAPKASPFVQRLAGGAADGALQNTANTAASGRTSAKDLAEAAAMGAGGGALFESLGSGIGKGLSALRERRAAVPPELDDATHKAFESVTPEPVAPKKMGVAYGRLKPASNEQYINKVMGDIKSTVTERMTPPLENPKELAKWLQPHLGDASLNEIRQLPYEDMRQLAEEVRSHLSTYDMAQQAAKERGYDLDQLLNGQTPSLTKTADRLRMGRVAGAVEAPKGSIRLATSKSFVPTDSPTVVQAEVEAERVLQSVSEPRIRDRVYNYLDEQEKASRQRMAKRRGNINSNPLPEWGDMSIIMAAKMGKGTIKLADFTEEAVKEFGEGVRSKAPQLFRAAREELQRNERMASKEGKDAEAFNNSGQGDASTFDKKINYKPAKKQSKFSERMERVRTQLVDDLAPLEGLEKRVKGKVGSAEDSLYKSARLTKGIPERANQIVQERLNPLVSKVEEAGYTADDLGKYALARHAKDVNAAGFKSGFTNKEIEDVLNKYKGNQIMEDARKGLVQITRDTLQELVDSGVVSKELQSVLNERWKNYIPLFRAFDDESLSGGRGAADKLANIANPLKKLSGSERDVIDPLENLVKNIFQSVNASERNKVGSQLAKLATQDADSKFIRRLKPDEEVGRKNVVNVKENGENVKYEVEPEVYKAMLSLEKESSNMIINILAKPASLLRSGATLTPEFSLRNPMRDVLQAFVTSKSGFNPLTDFLVGLGSTIKKGELHRDWVDNLGAYGNVMSMDRNVHREALKKVLKEPVSKKFVNVVSGKALVNLLRYITDTTESATKVGEYRAALRKGQTKQEAAYRSRDLMDFARAGSGIRQANKMVAFLNANIQGKSKLLRAIKENPVGTITRSLAAVTVPTVGIYFWNHTHATETQKNTIEESPDWLKNSFWLIAVPGTDMVARIPKPFDLAPIFANLPERALDLIKGKDKNAFDGYAKSLVSSFAIPTQISGLLPLIEGMANYSFFREGSIIPQREDNVEYKDQYDPIRTTETAKLIAAGANKVTGGKGAFKNFSSPRVVDNTIQGLTAGLGTYATSAVDSLLQGKVFGKKLFSAIVDRPETPQKRLEQRPLVKSFLVDPLTNSRSLDKFYDERDKLTRANGSASLNDKKFDDSRRLKSLNKTSTRISKIGKEIREIEASREFTPVEKRRKIEPLLQERNDLAKKATQKE